MGLSLPTAQVLGVPVARVSPGVLVERLLQWKSGSSPRRIHCLSAAAIRLARADPRFRQILLGSDLNLPASPGVVRAIRLGGGGGCGSHPPRAWLPPLLRGLPAGSVIWYVGGWAPALAAWAAQLSRSHPPLVFRTRDGAFETWGPENIRVMAAVAATAPTLILVGLGSPFQEEYAHANALKLGAPLVITVGRLAEETTGLWPEGPWSGGQGGRIPQAGVGRWLQKGMRRRGAQLEALALAWEAARARFARDDAGGSV